MIWDLHCHLSGVPGRTPDERMARLIEAADRMGIERIVIFMGFPFVRRPSPDELRRQNDQVLQALSHWHHRAFGFVYVSPEQVEVSLNEIDRCVRDGPMVGIKLWVAVRCSDPRVDPIIQRAAKHNAVIFQHTWRKVGGNDPGESTASDLAVLAERHPEVPLICGHTGGDWELGIRAVRRFAHVSISLGGFDPTAGVVEMAVRELGSKRILYASDAGGRSFASQLAKVQGASIPNEDKERILGRNLRQMMTPILKAKGVSF